MSDHGQAAPLTNVCEPKAIVLKKLAQHYVIFAIKVHVQDDGLRAEGVLLSNRWRSLGTAVITTKQNRQVLMVFDGQCIWVGWRLVHF